MPTLANIQGSSLVPDLSGSLNLALQAFGTPQSRAADEEALLASEQARQLKAQQQQSLQQIITDLTQGTGGTAGPTGKTGATGQAKRRQDAMIRLSTINPQAATGIQKILQAGQTAELDAIRKETNKGARQAKLIKGKGSFIERQKALTQLAASTAAEGKDITRLVELSNLSESELDLELDKMLLQATDIETITGSAPGAGKKFTKGAGVRTQMADGSFAIVTPVLNEVTGQVENQVTAIPGALVSTIGETGEQLTGRKIGEAGGIAEVRAEVALETAAPLAGETAKGSATQVRRQKDIDSGFTAADSLAVVNRSLELLESLETGGIDQVKLEAKRLFGIESADEAELSAGLSKAVLSQLRGIFGAAFTASEGERLIAIEAGFGKSTAGNIRLLQQTKAIIMRAAKRGIRAAEKNDQPEIADEIREAMKLTFGPKAEVVEEVATPGKIKLLRIR